MSSARVRVVFIVQVFVLHLSFAVHKLRRGRTAKDIEWIVGPYEIALLVHNIAAALPGARSVVLRRHPFYNVTYDWEPSSRTFPGSATLSAWLHGPALLGRLAARSNGFIYLSAEGFLNAAHDQRRYEFRFLKKHGCTIACYFTGNDIRSPKLMKELELETGRPNLGTYLAETDRVFALPSYDDLKKRIAETANLYADVVFNADVDQRAYLTPPTRPFIYFTPDDEISDDFSRYEGAARPIILHAPSSPIIKGTPLVRAAIDQLREEGYDFEYVELVRVSNDEVKRQLSRAHITLNEFYAAVPGVFGVEAMAAGSVLLTSADEHVELQLPAGSNDAWVVTAHHQIATNLRRLLDDRSTWADQARAGVDWVRAHAATSVTSAELARVLARR